MKLPPDLHRFRLGVFTNSPDDARSLSRLFGPFNIMRREDRRLEIVLPRYHDDNDRLAMDWSWFTGLDAMYFLDPRSETEAKLIRLAKECGCRVWVDYIDDVLNVRPSNPSFMHTVLNPTDIRTLEFILDAADFVTCTTNTIKERLPYSIP